MKNRLDVMLTEKNMFPSREKAKASIMAGLVYVDGQRIDKPGTPVDDNAEIKDRAFGSNDRRFCAICVIRCSPYLLTRSLQSLNFPNSRTRPTTNGAFNSKSMPSFSTSQKRKSEKELI